MQCMLAKTENTAVNASNIAEKLAANTENTEGNAAVNAMMLKINNYVAGYALLVPPTVINDDIVMITIKVLGVGDYLPRYAGNLDIINCAAVGVAEDMATNILGLIP